MSPLILAILVFLVFFLGQLLFWRIYRPVREGFAVALLILGVGAVSLAVLLAANFGKLDFLSAISMSASEIFYFCFAYFSLGLAYMLSYPRSGSESSTCLMLLEVEKAGTKGCSIDDFKRVITNELLIGFRIRGLLQEGLIVKINDTLVITAKGESFLRIFLIYRKLISANHLETG